MAWVAVDKFGNEGIYANKPVFDRGYWCDVIVTDHDYYYDTEIPLPNGSIKKLIGRNLTCEDSPVELTEE